MRRRHPMHAHRGRPTIHFGPPHPGSHGPPDCRRGAPHLHLAIYRALLGVTLLTVVATICVAKLLWDPAQDAPPPLVTRGSQLLIGSLPSGPGLPDALRTRAEQLGVSLGLYDAHGQALATGGADPLAPALGNRFEWLGGPGRGGFSLQLDDGRYLTLDAKQTGAHRHFLPFLGVLALLLFTMAIGTRPVARRITRRLEALEEGMDRFGAGDLSARVTVRGRDEVARVAQAFNTAAGQVQTLVGQQRRMLASASHELRAPLARLRMALELAEDDESDQSPERRARMLSDAKVDIAELDDLVSDLLMAARLSHPDRSRQFVDVDLAALCRLECRRVGLACEIADEGLICPGEPAMLRRLVRNLLDNAHKYGGEGPITLTLQRGDDGPLRLCVLDRGPGVPDSERERIFEPFYRPQGHAETRDGGVGLGLSLVRQIAEHHGGSVRYQPREGGGSCFEVSLPATQKPVALG